MGGNAGCGILISGDRNHISNNITTGNTLSGIDIASGANTNVVSRNNSYSNTGTDIVNLGTNTILLTFNKMDATSAPTSSNDITEQYFPGSLWTDTSADKSYICVDNSSGSAIWKEITNDSSSGTFGGDYQTSAEH